MHLRLYIISGSWVSRSSGFRECNIFIGKCHLLCGDAGADAFVRHEWDVTDYMIHIKCMYIYYYILLVCIYITTYYYILLAWYACNVCIHITTYYLQDIHITTYCLQDEHVMYINMYIHVYAWVYIHVYTCTMYVYTCIHMTYMIYV